MKLGRLVPCAFLQRLNRFAALVELEGSETLVHVANSGRMRELQQAGNLCLLTPQTAPGRKTAYDLALVEVEAGYALHPPGRSGREHRGEYESSAQAVKSQVLVSADARLPPGLVWEAFQEGRLPPFARWKTRSATCFSISKRRLVTSTWSCVLRVGKRLPALAAVIPSESAASLA